MTAAFLQQEGLGALYEIDGITIKEHYVENFTQVLGTSAMSSSFGLNRSSK